MKQSRGKPSEARAEGARCLQTSGGKGYYSGGSRSRADGAAGYKIRVLQLDLNVDAGIGNTHERGVTKTLREMARCD